MVRKWLLASVASGCLLAGNAALASDKMSPEAAPSGGTIVPFYGSINPFYGNINPFYGSINPFYGSINPFYGQISPFWGNIQPFWGNIQPFYGTINPFYGNIDPFWGKVQPFYGTINPFWGSVGVYWKDAGPQWGAINDTWTQLQANHATDYSSLQVQIADFMGRAKTFWSPAVKQYTGKDFNTGFANDLFAKYGIDPNDPNSLANTDAATRSFFFLNWYDGLMNFTGVDHIDWWMPAVNWSPALTQMQASGGNAVVGILDSTVTASNADIEKIKFIGGYKSYVNDHGAAVASLIAAQHDGQSVMGIDPNASILLYNPFDQTGTASWSDVATGIAKLYDQGAHVVNASLGVPGAAVSNEWVNILSGPLLSSRKGGLVIVKAAGNEGVKQTANVPWLLGLEAPNNLIVVGSVGPTGDISPFSNTPGEACFTVLGLCAEQNKLKYRFVVAPGELILVSDNHGGVTRMSGTSFAAPLVTGAVALLQDRWPWLQSHAEETVQIIFKSAKDLGAPGVDPVYGWGELDIEASQSPLDFGNLVVYQPSSYNGKSVTTGLGGFLPNSPFFANWSANALKASVLKPGQLALWQNQGAYVVAFENIGSTYRDFSIPLSSLLAGKNQKVNGDSNPFQTYLYQRLVDWARGTNSLAFDAQAMALSGGDWKLSMVTTQSSPDEERAGDGPFHAQFVASNAQTGLDVRVGEGSGAFALMGGGGFNLRSDFDPETGGVNPVLGFASGGAYAAGGIAVTHDLHVSLGFSQKSDDHIYMDPTFGPLKALPLDTSRAAASVAGIDYTLAKGVTLNASYTMLDEANGLLGAQGSGTFALNGARTQGTTLGMTAQLASGWTLSGSATMAHTTAPAAVASSLALSRDGLQSTAFAFVATKTGLFSDIDTMRLSVTQPLHVESGSLNYTALEVVDRQTGAMGPVTQSWGIAGAREYRMEAMYGLPVLEGRGAVNGFALVDVNPPGFEQTPVSLSVGAQLRFNF